MTSPFTFTPGMAGEAYIDMHHADEIVDNFTAPESERFVYKILGLRGSGKSVVYSKALNALKQKNNWLVYTVSSGGDPLKALIGSMSKESFISSYKSNYTLSAESEVEGNIKIIKGTGKACAEMQIIPDDHYYDDESALKDMVEKATKKGYKVLVGIDDIAKTKEMVRFLSVFGDMVLTGDRNIYLLCTGTSKNIEDFASEQHLSFFVRGDKIEITGLSIHQITQKYIDLLGVDFDKAKELAGFTCGYAYAYQVLGELCYKNKTSDILSVVRWFDASMADQYDIIWSQLTDAEKDFVKAVVNSETGEKKDIENRIEKKANYNTIRSRLLKKHLLTVIERGRLTVNLPHIKEYLEMW